MHDRRRSPIDMPLRLVLRVLSLLFGWITFWRTFLYDHGILRSRQVPCRVVCIGNITAGGTGKTPLVILTAELLRDRGVHVAVVSRGHGRSSNGALVVSDGVSILTQPDQSGDEAHIIADALTGVPVVVGRDRYQAAMLAYERFNPEVILLDDGFQHRKLFRDVDILTMDASNPIGSEFLLPRGLLRESPYGVRRAKAVVITRLRAHDDRERIERQIRYYDRSIPVFWSRVVADGLREPGSGKEDGLAEISGMTVAALSNVANPASFYDLIEADYGRIVYRRAMPDHHRYTAGELQAIALEAAQTEARYLIMTAKDERNLPADYTVQGIALRVLDIDAELDGREDKYLSLVYPTLNA